MCAVQAAALTWQPVDVDIDVTLDGDGLSGTDWPRVAGAPQVVTLRLQAVGMAVPGGIRLEKAD